MDNLDQLKDIIDACLEDPRFAEGRKEVRAETWAFPSEGAVRTADYLMNKYNELTAEEAEKEAENVGV